MGVRRTRPPYARGPSYNETFSSQPNASPGIGDVSPTDMLERTVGHLTDRDADLRADNVDQIEHHVAYGNQRA